MERAIDLWRACTPDRVLDMARMMIVLLSAVALIAAGRVLPF